MKLVLSSSYAELEKIETQNFQKHVQCLAVKNCKINAACCIWTNETQNSDYDWLLTMKLKGNII